MSSSSRRRFTIRRHPIDYATASPWVLRDASRPAYLGHYATLALALDGVDRKLRQERGGRDYIPTRREIREAMTITTPGGRIIGNVYGGTR